MVVWLLLKKYNFNSSLVVAVMAVMVADFFTTAGNIYIYIYIYIILKSKKKNIRLNHL